MTNTILLKIIIGLLVLILAAVGAMVVTQPSTESDPPERSVTIGPDKNLDCERWQKYVDDGHFDQLETREERRAWNDTIPKGCIIMGNGEKYRL